MNRPKTLDPIMLEVIKNALTSVANEMSFSLRRTSMSPILYEMLDFCVDLYNSKTELIAEGRGSVAFQGTVNIGINKVVEHVGRENVEEGDVFIAAWSYFAGSHNPDVLVFKPIFCEKEIFGYAAAKAHWADIGASSPFAANYTDMYQEGLILPGVKVVKKGVLDKEIVDIIRHNTRLPDSTIGDLTAQIACCEVGEKGLLALVDKYGKETMILAMEAIMDQDEKLMRQTIAKIPDGEYSAEGGLDSNGLDDNPLKVRVTVTVLGDELTIDTTGSAPQTPGPMNCPFPSTVALLRVGVKMLLDPHTRSSGGHWRPLKVVAPEASIYNPQPPAATYLYGWTGTPLGECIFKALAEVLPEKTVARSGGDICAGVRFYGISPRDGKWFFCVPGQGPIGHGASFDSDGGDALIIYGMSGSESIPHEVMEERFPILIEKWCLRQDSGGPGKFRGGLGIEKDVQILTDVVGGAVIEQTKFPPWGLFGGKSGFSNLGILWPGTDKEKKFGKVTEVSIKKGESHTVLTGGGGGWGNPYERDPESVLKDVIKGYVSRESARKDYGVVIREENGICILDEEASNKMRESNVIAI